MRNNEGEDINEILRDLNEKLSYVAECIEKRTQFVLQSGGSLVAATMKQKMLETAATIRKIQHNDRLSIELNKCVGEIQKAIL